MKQGDNSNFWFSKGIQTHTQDKDPIKAVFLYKEALRLNIDNYGAMFNLAACYES